MLEGWPLPTSEVQSYIDNLPTCTLQLLTTRGINALHAHKKKDRDGVDQMAAPRS